MCRNIKTLANFEPAATDDEIRASASNFSRRPRVFFEEWHEPLISGIRWVDELIEIAGGDPIYPELREQIRTLLKPAN